MPAPTFGSLSRTAQAAYGDLLRLHLDEAVPEILGAIEERRRGPRTYLYDQYRLGTEIRKRYLGEDTPELRARIARAAQIRSKAEERRKTMGRLCRLLRTEGPLGVDRGTGSLLAAFARSGVFRLGGTLVGTAAYGLYQAELGVRFDADELAQTGDIDFASFHRLSVALEDRVVETPGAILEGMRFDPVPGIWDRQVWRWIQSSGEVMVEFLTPAFGDEGVLPLPALGVSAQGLRYLNYLIADPLQAVALYRSGVLVQIPRPERFAIHKLIVADRRGARSDPGKAVKDRAQAALLIEVLAADRPGDLAEALDDARGRGQRWRERIAASLALMPETARTLAALEG